MCNNKNTKKHEKLNILKHQILGTLILERIFMDQ